MNASRSTTQPKPQPATPPAPDNGVPGQPTLAALMALEEQAQAALDERRQAVQKAQADAATALRKEQLAEATTAAKAYLAEADGEADLAKLAEAAKVVWITTTAMAKAAKVKTGAGRSRGPAGGDIRADSDADHADQFLSANTGGESKGWHTVREVASIVEGIKGYAHNADGQVRNALDKLVNVGRAEKNGGSPMMYRHRDIPTTPEVLKGVTTEGTEPAPTE